jgi:hypothetical protein
MSIAELARPLIRTVAQAGASPDACVLLSAPVPSTTNSNYGGTGGLCEYLFGTKKFSNRMQDSDDAIGSQKPLPESGVGDAVYSKMGALFSPSHDRMRGLMLTALSR